MCTALPAMFALSVSRENLCLFVLPVSYVLLQYLSTCASLVQTKFVNQPQHYALPLLQAQAIFVRIFVMCSKSFAAVNK